MENTQTLSNQNPTGVEVQPRQASPDNDKLFATILISILLTTIVIGSAVYFWQRLISKKTTSSLEQRIAFLEMQLSSAKETKILQPTSSSLLSTSPTTDPTANWETYTSSSGKYSIKHPKEWILKGDEYHQKDIAMGMNSVAVIENSDTNFSNKLSIHISSKPISTGENLQKAKEVLELWRENYQGQLEEITVNGIFAYKLIYTYSDPVSKVSRIDIRLEKSGLLYNIELSVDNGSPNKDKLLQIGNQILSTFKFIN